MKHCNAPANCKFWTPGVIFMVFVMGAAVLAAIGRYVGGISYISNLSNARPWGIWVGIDVASGVALAAGGFTTAFLAHIMGRHKYEPIIRPALLTAMLGYTVVAMGLLVDIGRSWAIWKPMFYWNFHSPLFEVAMCVMCYLTVLYIEFFPLVIEQFKDKVNLPSLLAPLNKPVNTLLTIGDTILGKTMWIFLILGVVLSCMHQSSLGTLMLIAPTKIHPLWYTPILPLLFLTSAIALGYPMVVFESTLVSKSLKTKSESHLFASLTKITIFLLGFYMFLKIADMIWRGTYTYLLDGTVQTNSFIIEMLFGVIVPWIMLIIPKVRHSSTGVFIASTMIILGVILNRVNVFIVGYTAPVTKTSYFPSLSEMLITAGLVAFLMFVYRVLVTFLPVLGRNEKETV